MLTLGRALASIGAGEAVGAGRLTVGVFLEQWLAGARPALKPSTAKRYGEVVEWYVRPRIGQVRLDNLNALHLRSLYADLLAEVRRGERAVSRRPRCGWCTVLRKALNDAVLWVLVARSPLPGVKPPRAERPALRWWTPAQARPFVATGMLSIVRTRVSVAYAVCESDPKTRSSRRTITVDARMVGVMRAHRRRQLEERLAWGEAWTDTGYVFTWEDGWPIHPERTSVLFARLVDAAGLPRIRLHDLRHTSASLALRTMSERLNDARTAPSVRAF
jgi:hypothetical protein